MMTDLFSALDCNQINLGFLLWMSPMFLVLIFSTVFNSKNHIMTFFSVISGVHSDVRKTMAPLSLFLFSLMLFLVLMNLIGLAPYVYGITSNLWTASSLALLLWGLLLVSGWQNNPAASAAHLAPAGAPAALVPFLVLIETVSILIRPLTLTVRLIANISAGHIVLSLVANCLTSVSGLSFFLMLMLNTGYNMFEIFVCVIQAYIFSLLVKLYAEEHP
uniref:ATP synthase F0 subunit 6 n=1 Tax=Philine kinglipini TaxID=3030995 RepID=UPI002551E6E7|nr:ATP synthase F0 subunit 6 [Philine kinglipini]WFG53986.1 ATP synthase F0 subunit 6 [Philine kinglipini]